MSVRTARRLCVCSGEGKRMNDTEKTTATVDDCISRKLAVELAMQYCPDDDGSCPKAGEDLRGLLDDLENAPAVDVAPVRHGRMVWKEREGIAYRKLNGFWDQYGCWHSETITVREVIHTGKEPFCSECGASLSDCAQTYCHRCGVKLDLEDDRKERNADD